MQIKLFTIPIMGGERSEEEMNIFLKSKRVLAVEQKLVDSGNTTAWCFCVRYLDDITMAEREKNKIDYRTVLTEVEFGRFSRLRQIRKQLSIDEAGPAYAIFTDEELSAFAKHESLTAPDMHSVKGVGDKKMEKYAKHFITPTS